MKKNLSVALTTIALLSFTGIEGCDRSLGTVENTLAWTARTLRDNNYSDFVEAMTPLMSETTTRADFDDLRAELDGLSFGDLETDCAEPEYMARVSTSPSTEFSNPRMAVQGILSACADWKRVDCTAVVPMNRNGQSAGIITVEMVCKHYRLGDRTNMPCPGANFSTYPTCLVDEIDIELE